MTFGFFTLHCNNLDAMAEWYRDVVGFTQNCDFDGFKGFATEKGVFFNMVKRGGGDFLENSDGLEYPHGINDTMSIGLGVPTYKDVDIAYKRLTEGGAKGLKPPETGSFGRDAYVADPEGNVICINAMVE